MQTGTGAGCAIDNEGVAVCARFRTHGAQIVMLRLLGERNATSLGAITRSAARLVRCNPEREGSRHTRRPGMPR